MPTVYKQHQDPVTNSFLKFTIHNKKLNYDCKSTSHIGTYIHETFGDTVYTYNSHITSTN